MGSGDNSKERRNAFRVPASVTLLSDRFCRGVLEFFGPGDAILVGLGHECEQKAAAVARLKLLAPELGKASYKLLNINMTGGGSQYVEYVLIGYGVKCKLEQMGMAWLGPMPLSVDKETRIRKCEMSTSPNAILERAELGESMTVCEVCRAVRQRFITAVPKSTKAARASAGDDFLGAVMASQDTSHDASSISSDEGENEEPAHREKREEETVDAVASLHGPGQAAGGGPCKLRPSRQGLPAQAWLSLLGGMSPTRVVLAGPLTCQAGLLVAIMQHNDARFGFEPCPLVAFGVDLPPGPREREWTKKEVKWWQAAHLCFHTVEAALQGYTALRQKAMSSNAGLSLGYQSRLSFTAFAKRALKREGSITGSGAQASPEVPLAPVQGTDGQSAASRLPEVTQFIQIAHNYGKDAKFPRKPSGEEKPQVDSDDDGDAPSRDVSQVVLARRNQRFLAKHSVKVQMSSETTGMGLFVTTDWQAGTQVPVKGPWFETLPEVQKFLAEMPDAAKTMFRCRVVRVSVSSSADSGTSDGKPDAIYKVITCPVGFVNHFMGLSNQPNCVLTWVSGVGLGEHTLTLKTTKIVKAGGQLLLNYGPLHQCSAKPRKVGAKAASKKKAAESQTKKE